MFKFAAIIVTRESLSERRRAPDTRGKGVVVTGGRGGESKRCHSLSVLANRVCATHVCHFRCLHRRMASITLRCKHRHTLFPWLVFFFGALLWGSMIHKHTGRWMWQGSTWQDQSYLRTERNTLVNPNWFQPCQCCCCLYYPGEYLRLGALISYNWAQVFEACDCLKLRFIHFDRCVDATGAVCHQLGLLGIELLLLLNASCLVDVKKVTLSLSFSVCARTRERVFLSLLCVCVCVSLSFSLCFTVATCLINE